MANNNHLNLDKFQTSMIKRQYSIIKPILAKREKAQKKIDDKQKELDELKASVQVEINTYNEQIAALDKFTLDTTERFTGIALSSEQVMDFLEHPENFEAFKQAQQEPLYNENLGEANSAQHDLQ